MATRHFVTMAYLGMRFHGWQVQPNASSVQETVEKAFSTLFRMPLQVTGAGRTDAGVNASMMVAHVDLPVCIDDDARLVRSLNSILGRDIVVRSVHPVGPDAHARFDATSRTYHYYAHTHKNPFTGGLSWLAPAGLDFDAMNAAAKVLTETSDFTSFSKLHTDVKTNICRVTRALWRRAEVGEDLPGAPEWVFEITADRFLRNMVRAVVGTLVEVGRGRLSVEGSRPLCRRHIHARRTAFPSSDHLSLRDITLSDLHASYLID